MEIIFIIVFILITIGLAPIVKSRIKSGRFKNANVYSYKLVILTSLIAFYIVVVVSLIVFLTTKSLEVVLGLGLFLFACVFAGCMKGLLFEYHIKRRGGEKMSKQLERKI